MSECIHCHALLPQGEPALSSYCGSLHHDCVVGHQAECEICAVDRYLNMA